MYVVLKLNNLLHVRSVGSEIMVRVEDRKLKGYLPVYRKYGDALKAANGNEDLVEQLEELLKRIGVE